MRNSGQIRWLGAGCAMLMASAACAAPADDGDTAARLTQLQSETVLLQAQLKKLETEQQVTERAAQLARARGIGQGAQLAVTAIEGVGARRFATLRINGGAEFEVQRGDQLPGGGRVTAIEPGAVVVSNGGRTYRLSTASAGAAGVGAPLPRDASLAPPLPALSASGS
ncbi:type IV pilus biogenesis protein PilP [Burkholderia sp. FERM BP-3421]|uniref:type IV pilus biogenesis protein PilP n=1 Tax=Burkholderia sp. FERM BP-3421 TaxID=1494466 RepID=UPI003FCC6E7E